MRTSFFWAIMILGVTAACTEAADPDDTSSTENTGGNNNTGGGTTTGGNMNTGGGTTTTTSTTSMGGGGPDIGGLVINEISAAGDDWIELYNTTNAPIDLTGVRVADDDAGAPKADEAADLAGIVVDGGGYFFILADQAAPPTGPQTTCDPGTAPCIHTGWGISAPNGDVIYLIGPGDAVLLSEPYPANATVAGESWARMPDGTGAFGVAATPTPGAANQ